MCNRNQYCDYKLHCSRALTHLQPLTLLTLTRGPASHLVTQAMLHAACCLYVSCQSCLCGIESREVVLG